MRFVAAEGGENFGSDFFLREALFTSGSAKLDLSVRPYVRPSVRIIIDFCDWDMEGDEALLLIGSLNYDFGRSEQKLKKVFKNKH